MADQNDNTPVDHRWIIYSGAAALILAIIGAIFFLPGLTTQVVPGIAVANDREVTAAAVDRKAADDAAAAKKAADDAAAFLASTEGTVKQSMQEYLNDPANGVSGANITVYAVNLIAVGDNKFEGEAEMSAGSGPHKQVIVHVSADDQNTQWETDKGGLLPLFQ